jgi:hypothetical protein
MYEINGKPTSLVTERIETRGDQDAFGRTDVLRVEEVERPVPGDARALPISADLARSSSSVPSPRAPYRSSRDGPGWLAARIR